MTGPEVSEFKRGFDMVLSSIFCLGLGILIGWLLAKGKKGQSHQGEESGLTQFRIDADEQFRSLHVSSNRASLVFDGAEAEVVWNEEHVEAAPGGGAIIGHSITRYAMNRSGEYFMFRSNIGARPFIKHLPHDRAKLVLKDKYREPSHSAAASGSSTVTHREEHPGLPA